MSNKSILIVNTPEKCDECRLMYIDGEKAKCGWCKMAVGYGKSDRCPLRPLPRKIDIKAQEDIDYQRFYENPDAKRLADEIVESQGVTRIGSTRDIYHAWNACIDAITGETE